MSAELIGAEMKRIRWPAFERLEWRQCLDGFGFAVHEIDVPEPAGTPSMVLADLDGDGDRDLLSESIWRPNDGSGEFGPARLMFTERPFDRLLAVDVDQDGDVDVVASGTFNSRHELAWFENRDGRGLLGPTRIIASTESNQVSLQLAGTDFDDDGDIDLLESSHQALRLYENLDGSGTFQLAYEWKGMRHPVVEDVDLDGDADIVASQSSSLVLLEFKNGTYLAPSVIHGQAGPLAIGDVNQDGVVDWILGESAGLQWYEWNPEDRTTTWRQTIRDVDVNGFAAIRKVVLGDIDIDGDLDIAAVVTSESADVIPFLEVFQLRETRYEEIFSIPSEGHFSGDVALCLCDVNGDLAADLVSQTAVRTFTIPAQQFAAPRYFADNFRAIPSASSLADLDGDGDLDAVFADWFDGCFIEAPYPCEARLSWFENMDGKGSFSPRKVVWKSTGLRVDNILMFDVDEDSDLDMVFWRSESDSSGVQWIENLDGQGSFGNALALSSGRLLGVADLDRDGSVDRVTQERDQVVVVFGRDRETVTVPGRAAPSSPLLDWDADGDLDLVVANGSTLYWRENLGGRQFSEPQVVMTDASFPFGYQFLDLDEDGDQDVVWSTFPEVTLVWQQNLGPNQWSELRPIAPRTHVVPSFDVDQDGDLDVFAFYAGKRALYLNDGQGNFTRAPMLIDPLASAWGDIDGDGDLDFLSLEYAWYERRTLGDANGDGRFNSTDLVAVFQSGKFDHWIERNSTFQTGDWNGDGDFNSTDLILALQVGNYRAE